MEVQKLLIKSSIQFENIEFKSKFLQFIYFCCSFIFSVPILIVILDSGSPQFPDSKIHAKLMQQIDSLVSIQSQILYGLLIAFVTISVFNFYAINGNYNPILLNLFTFLILLISACGNFICWFLVGIISHQKSNFVMITLSLIGVIQILIYGSIIQKFWTTFSFTSKNDFAHKPNTTAFVLNLIQKIIFIFQSYLIYKDALRQNSIQQILFQLTFVIINVAKIITLCREKYYIDEVSNSYKIFGATFSCAFILVDFITHLVHESVIESNQLSISIIVGAFAMTTVDFYLNNKQNQLYFQNSQYVFQQNSIVSYLQSNRNLWKNINQSENSIIIASIRKNHSFQCRKTDCYCHHDLQTQVQNNRSFFKGYLKEMVEYFSKQLNKQHTKMYLLNFQLEVFENPLGIGREVKTLKLHNRIPFEISLGIALLQDKLYESVNKKILRSDQTSFQLPIKLDQAIIQLQKIILSQVQTKKHKWQYLCRSLIKSLEIEEDIVRQITNISRFETIFNQNKYLFKKSLSFNSLSLFYYAQIVFLKKQVKWLQQNLKQIKTINNCNFIINYRQLSKNIFDPKCCLLQIDLSQSEINHNFSFSVSNCNRNIQNLFKYSREKIIGKSVSQLYPAFLWNQIKKIFLSFLNQNNKEISSHCYDNYFLDKSGNVFKALQCLNVTTKPEGVHLLLLLFEKQSQNIIILDERKKILNVSQTFVKYFGNTCQGLPFEALYYREQQYYQMIISDKVSQWQPRLIYGEQIGKQWKIYLQKVKNYMNKQVNNKYKQKSPTTLKSFTTRNYFNNEVSQFLSDERHRLMSNKLSSESSNEKANQRADNKSKSVLVVNFEARRCSLSSLQFYEIKFEGFKRNKPKKLKKRTLYDSPQQNTLIPEYNHSKGESQNSKNRQQYSQEVQCQDDEQQVSADMQKEEQVVKLQRQNVMFENNSVQSSAKGQTTAHFYHNFIDICFNLFKNPQEIRDSRLFRFTLLSFLLSMMISLVVIFTQEIFDLGLHQIKDILFADGAISDNLSLTQFMYNRAMNFKQFKNNPTEFASIAMSAYDQRQYLIDLLKYDIQEIQNSVTKMTNRQFYQYLKVPVKWNTNGLGEVQIQSSQMILLYYYLSRQVELNILNGTVQSDKLVHDNLKLMKTNFDQLKNINHLSLSIYKQMSDKSLNLTDKLTYILGASHLFLSIVIFLVFYNEKVFRRKQQVEGYSIYKLIPKRIIQILSTYYMEHSVNIRQRSDLLKYQTHFQRQGLYLPSDGSVFLKPNSSTFVTNNFKSPLAIYKMSGALFVINFIFAIILYQISSLVDPISNIMNNVNGLISSQNSLLETYFQLKARFVIDQNFTVDPTFFYNLQSSMHSNEVAFNELSVESLKLFTDYDETFKSDFISLLITNVCELSKSQITPQQYNKCKSYFKINIISDGVILGMNFFTRKIQSTIAKYKLLFQNTTNNNITLAQQQQILNHFKDLDFREIDQSIIYMFKMYQATQNRIYQSLEKTIVNLLNFSLTIVIIEVFIIGLMYPIVLFLNYRNQKIELSKIYVSFLLIPTPISKMIKAFAGKIEQVLEVDKNFE